MQFSRCCSSIGGEWVPAFVLKVHGAGVIDVVFLDGHGGASGAHEIVEDDGIDALPPDVPRWRHLQ